MRIDLIVNTTARRYESAPSLVNELRAASHGHAGFHATRDLAELSHVCAEAARARSPNIEKIG